MTGCLRHVRAVSPFLTSLLLVLVAKPAVARVVAYPAPQGMPKADGITVTADGQDVFVHEVQVNFNRKYSRPTTTEPTPVAHFDFSGAVRIVVQRETPISSVTVRPLSLGIVPDVSRNQVRFTLNKPAKLTLEFNDGLHGALHLFADPLEVDPPKQGDAGVRYYGPGIHNTPITLESDQTVYLAGGAVVRGGIRGENVRNVKIRGRGMLNGGPIRLTNCENIELNGIHNFRPNERGWMVTITNSRKIKIINYKSIGCGPNSDGIDPVSSQDISIRDCFMRQWDDIFALKGLHGVGEVRNVEISDCVLWSDLAQVFEIGYETRCKSIRDVYVHDCTVLHAHHLPVVSIHAGSEALITNIRYEDITVEQGNLHAYDPYLIDLWIGSSHWTGNDRRGSIDGVTIKDMRFLSGSFEANRIAGHDADHRVKNVTIENLRILNKRVLGAEDGRFRINEHVDNVEFFPGPNK